MNHNNEILPSTI